MFNKINIIIQRDGVSTVNVETNCLFLCHSIQHLVRNNSLYGTNCGKSTGEVRNSKKNVVESQKRCVVVNNTLVKNENFLDIQTDHYTTNKIK